MKEWFDKFAAEFTLNFIKEDRWLQLLKGLGITLIVTFFAVLIGIIIGVVIAAVRSTYDKSDLSAKKGVSGVLLKIANIICNIYLTIIRGTPVVVQLMIAYYIIFASSNNKILVASLAFGFNSGSIHPFKARWTSRSMVGFPYSRGDILYCFDIILNQD